MSAPRPYGHRSLPWWLTATVVGFVCAIGFGFWTVTRRQTVEIINALDVDVEVQLGSSKTTVKHGQRASVWVPKGPTVIITTAGSIELERLLVTVPSSDRVVYNVAGAGFLFRETISYSARAIEPEYVFFCGQSFVDLGAIDFWFEEEVPRTLSTKQTVARRTRMVWQKDPQLCVGWLFQQSDFKALLPLVLAGTKLHPNDIDRVGLAATTLVAANRKRTAVGLVERLVTEHPTGEQHLEAQLLRQRILGLTDGLGKLDSGMTPPAADAPNDVYLYARLQEPKARIGYLDAIVKEDPSALMPRIGLAFALSEDEPARAVGLYEKLLTEDLGSRRRMVVLEYLRCLVALSRVNAASEFVAKNPFPADATYEEIAVQAVISALAQKPEAGRSGFSPRARAWADVLRGREPDKSDVSAFFAPQLTVAAKARRSLPQGMLGELQAPSFVPSTIPSAWLWPMICELDRVQPIWRSRLEPGLGADRQLIPRVLRFVRTGDPFPNMDRLLSVAERSGVWLARARWLEANTGEADPKTYRKAFAQAHAEVTRLDPFRLWGAALRETWGSAQPVARSLSQWTVIE